MSRIVIDRESFADMRAHAIVEYPFECCGALFGEIADGVRRVRSTLRIDNTAGQDRRRRFSIAPRDYLRAERHADALGLALLGFYHSHPDHPALPSETDRRFAQHGFSYPILSVGSRDVVAVTSWRIGSDSPDAPYEQEALEVAADDGTPGSSG